VSVSSRSERGQVAVLFALLIPVLFALAAVVIDIGNWYVHKRHLQTQVDAAALAPAPEFSGCFDPNGWAGTDQAIESRALGLAGDTLRPGILGTNSSTTTNLQVQEPGDVRVVLNSDRYWQPSDGYDPTGGYGLDKTLDSADADTDGGFCNEKAIDVKATDEDAPPLWGLIPLTPSPKSHARAEIFDEVAAEGILPFAVPEVVPGSVWALFVDESKPDGQAVISRAKLTPPPIPDPTLSDYAVYEGSNTAQPITFTTGLDHVGVIILVSRSDVTDPDVGSTSITTICQQTGVRCYSGGGATSGLALIVGHETGNGPKPIVRQVDVGGCNSSPNPPNQSGPYFTQTGDCTVAVTAEIDFTGLTNPRAELHMGATCGGNGANMSGSGSIFTAATTLPEPTTSTGQVPMSISWRTSQPNKSGCFGLVARPYVANRKSGPVEYLKLSATNRLGNPVPNAYSSPNDGSLQPITYKVTVGLLRPLRQSTLSDKPVLIRYSSEDNPSETQSIDCDVDNYKYPAPYDTLPSDAAEIAYGCVTPYKENPTLDCSAYSNGDLPPPAPPTTTFDNAPDCAQSKNGLVSSLRKGLVARLNEPTCAPNNWPDPPITQDKITNLITNFGNDPRLVTLIVTEFGAFSGSGNTIIPIRYFAGFYMTGKDVSAQSPRCPGEDPHPLYGSNYKQHLDDGDVWGYFITRVQYGSSGSAGTEHCDFTGTPQNCVLTLVE